jgi:hypothetical protein
MSRRHEITLTRLRYFAAAAERRSMAEAARELFVAQSAVSAGASHLPVRPYHVAGTRFGRRLGKRVSDSGRHAGERLGRPVRR